MATNEQSVYRTRYLREERRSRPRYNNEKEKTKGEKIEPSESKPVPHIEQRKQKETPSWTSQSSCQSQSLAYAVFAQRSNSLCPGRKPMRKPRVPFPAPPINAGDPKNHAKATRGRKMPTASQRKPTVNADSTTARPASGIAKETMKEKS
ncbi:hypothetical protein BKA56DRAFT_614766 [Ilyonectria sp. MPI-CAGE-AT-0026]|nr:hypothetical protein BKA56DRAFT_614766 [Ilyonectria sp. MPI-CAGE-AT-0026]